jgi:hypothetical protein
VVTSAEAFSAIAATFLEEGRAEGRAEAKGGYLLTRPHGVSNRLTAIRGPGESYSDVILRPAKGTVAARARGCRTTGCRT